jgi:hypothetical protein
MRNEAGMSCIRKSDCFGRLSAELSWKMSGVGYDGELSLKPEPLYSTKATGLLYTN